MTINNYGLSGISSLVQFGKGGAKVKQLSGNFELRNAADSAYVNLSVNTPTLPDHAATKQYVDAYVQGLDFKPSVRLATTMALPASSYDNGTAGVGATLTADDDGALTVDGVAVVAGDRILVKDEVDQTTNGIYE